MKTAPHILLADPAPAWGDLAARLRARGFACTVAHGLHDAMVQAAMRNPELIVTDLTTPHGSELRSHLEQITHFRHTRLLSIGGGEMLPVEQLVERIVGRLVEQLPACAGTLPTAHGHPSSPQPDTAPSATRPLPAPGTPLEEMLAQLAADRAASTVTVVGPDGAVGEVLLRDGRPFHAVTMDGLWGPEALRAMHTWSGARVEPGPAPRAEAPRTFLESAPAEPFGPEPPDHAAVARLLAELESVGVLRRLAP